ncbi:MAG: amidohydrolase family protein [Erysipelotrichaceae bacterium]|nr:amidohydrolase family protein [Erysipelotrichaceae bacterium]
MKYYHSSRIYTPDGMKDCIIGVEDGRFTCFIDGTIDEEVIDFGDRRIIPGIIDTHNHGAVGYRFQALENLDELDQALIGEASFGVTGIFPTVNKLEHLPILVEGIKKGSPGTRILGIHSEGPWGSRVGEKGDPKNTYYMPVDLEYAKSMVETGEGWLKLLAIAPEVPHALEAIEYLTSQGVTCSAYHTNANFEECNKGIEAGIRTATHLGNVMTGLHHRDVGTFGACLLDDRVWCELICDGMHVSLPMIRIVMKVKDHDKIMMVSDNGDYLGAKPGHYMGSKDNANNDRRTITVTEDGFVLSETGRISGSSKPVIYGISNLVEKLGMDLSEVVRMSSLNPALHYGLEGRGSIAKGNFADFVVIDDDYNVLNTFVDGKEVWNAEKDTRPFNPEFYDRHPLIKD